MITYIICCTWIFILHVVIKLLRYFWKTILTPLGIHKIQTYHSYVVGSGQSTPKPIIFDDQQQSFCKTTCLPHLVEKPSFRVGKQVVAFFSHCFLRLDRLTPKCCVLQFVKSWTLQHIRIVVFCLMAEILSLGRYTQLIWLWWQAEALCNNSYRSNSGDFCCQENDHVFVLF